MSNKITAISCATLVLLCASVAASQNADATTSVSTKASGNFTGMAHYYADNLHGKRTASGQVHDRTKMMAAHRSLPFGTRLKVTNKKNGKTCEVVVNDRGPFHPKFSLDLSQAAAKELGFFNAGKGLLECVIMDEKAILDSVKHVAKQPQAKPVVAQEAASSAEPLYVNPVFPLAIGTMKPAVATTSPVVATTKPAVEAMRPAIAAIKHEATISPVPVITATHSGSAVVSHEAPAPEIHTSHLPINDKLPTVFAEESSVPQEHHGILNPSNEIAGNVAIHKSTIY